MPETCPAKLCFAVFFLSCLILLNSGLWCEAHKVNMFASAEGNVISGSVYFTTGGNPKNAVIFVQDKDGTLIREITADEQGQFTFTAEARQDYVFVLELADGHRTSFTVKAEELSETLPSSESEAPSETHEQRISAETAQQASPGAAESAPANPNNSQLSAEELEKIVDKAVARQVRPLREQLDHYEAKIRLHDILGGIGYIIGLMGLGYFLRARKKRH
jgi:nickel transport protein